jgi:hypothetical protein
MERNEEIIDAVCTYLPFGLTAALLVFIMLANVNTSIQTSPDFQYQYTT